MQKPTKETKHTPGPWTICTQQHLGCWEYVIRAVDPHNPASGIGKHIAIVNKWLNPQADPRANAKLIASAPDLLEQRDELLEACKVATQALIALDPSTDLILRDIAFNACEAAISKAEGN